MNPNLYVRDPETSELGRNIVRQSIALIHDLGFEEFTFKKLAQNIGTTEAGIYRYFENKHRLLTYIITWFWTSMEYRLVFHTNNLPNARAKIQTAIRLLSFGQEDMFLAEHIDKELIKDVVISESNKAYLTKHVNEDNRAMLFKPYKDLCHRIAAMFLEYSEAFPYPHSLASTLIETIHHQMFFSNHLPRLTDFGEDEQRDGLQDYCECLIFSALDVFKTVSVATRTSNQFSAVHRKKPGS